MPKRRIPLIPCRVKGKAFVPLAPEWAMSAFDLAEGEMVFVKIDRERYWPGHQAFMAFIRDCWHSLPDAEREEYKNEDVLRYRLLIAAGYTTTNVFVCQDEAEAIRTARIIRSVTSQEEADYQIVSIVGAPEEPEKKIIVVVERARSQAMKAMASKEFRESVVKVEDKIAEMYGITRETIAAWKKERYSGQNANN